MSKHVFFLFAISLGFISGCQDPDPVPISALGDDKDYDRELPPGQLALRKITDPAQIPDFSDAFYNSQGPGLRDAILRSLHYLAKSSSQRYFPYGTDITHARAVASLQRMLDVLDQAGSPAELNRMLREQFDVYISVGCDDRGTVLYTGYYTPIFDGSMTRTGRFQHPIYKMPAGFQKDLEGNPVGGPWKTRQEIESSGALAGQELVWLDDPFKAYVVTVQGSGQIRMDGRIFEIGYAGNNGHDYVAIGKELVADGKIAKDQLSLKAMLEYFESNPQDIQTYCWKNPRYVFFKPAPGGPFGCLNEKVTTLHSIATDKDIFPRACLTFLDTSLPREDGGSTRPYKGFACDQDRGAAIRAAGRCDVFMGVGDQAGRRAGFTYSEGKLYYLFLKDGSSESFAGSGETTTGAPPAGSEIPDEEPMRPAMGSGEAE